MSHFNASISSLRRSEDGGGKSRAMSVLATYIAGLRDHSDALVPGEKGVLLWGVPHSINGWPKSSSTTARQQFETVADPKQLIANRSRRVRVDQSQYR